MFSCFSRRRQTVVIGCALWGFGLYSAAYAQKDATVPYTPRIFHGEWFDVWYPANFSASTASKRSKGKVGNNEVTFTSPDKRVQFYVFSPQWNGHPSFVKVAPDETLVSQTSERRKHGGYSTTTVKWVTVEAKNKTYTRTWEEVETTLNTRRVVGIKYQTEADFKKYRPQYLAFKISLKQFGD